MSALQRFTAESAAEWRAYTEHGFVRALTDGTLPPECFRHYLKQDYLFLHQYARALALGMYKSGSFGEIRALQQSLNAILEETLLHVGFCAEWGLGEDELLREPESAACVAYTRYVLDCGMKGTLADLYAALAPCVIGYAEIGRRAALESRPGNPYQAWIDTYADPAFQEAAAAFADALDAVCAGESAARLAALSAVFRTAVRMEAAFWQMGLDCSL
ncbi:Thiaminase-2 [Kingella potus]|uniref:Thiaminase-2 n=1 Tax=Kingella potus TaxID=265175 RepID=A0A377R1V3_9NEIS|nr:TenA family protein [Kingella potus]STR01005.1 Thiaminase-2 [Kingella potus]